MIKYFILSYEVGLLYSHGAFYALLGISCHTKLISKVTQLCHWQRLVHKFAICLLVAMYWNFILHDDESNEVKIHLNVFYHNTHRAFKKSWLLTPNECSLKYFILVGSIPRYTTPQYVVLSAKTHFSVVVLSYIHFSYVVLAAIYLAFVVLALNYIAYLRLKQ